MQSKILWQALAVIALFSGVETLTLSLATYFTGITPLGLLIFGGVLLLASVVLSFMREKLPHFLPFAVCLNAISCGAFIGAFALIHSFENFAALGVCALLPIAAFLLLMALFSLPFRDNRWFLGVTFAVWAVGAYFLGAWLLKSLFLQIPDEYLLAYLLFLLPVCGLALGCLLPSETWRELLGAMLVPSTVTVGFVGIIVLLVLANGDGCDCDCGDCGGDCCDCSTDYKSKNKKSTSMSELSKAEP